MRSIVDQNGRPFKRSAAAEMLEILNGMASTAPVIIAGSAAQPNPGTLWDISRLRQSCGAKDSKTITFRRYTPFKESAMK